MDYQRAVIRFGMPWPKIPFSARMAMVRLTDGLFSPFSDTAARGAEVSRSRTTTKIKRSATPIATHRTAQAAGPSGGCTAPLDGRHCFTLLQQAGSLLMLDGFGLQSIPLVLDESAIRQSLAERVHAHSPDRVPTYPDIRLYRLQSCSIALAGLRCLEQSLSATNRLRDVHRTRSGPW